MSDTYNVQDKCVSLTSMRHKNPSTSIIYIKQIHSEEPNIPQANSEARIPLALQALQALQNNQPPSMPRAAEIYEVNYLQCQRDWIPQ